MKFAPISRAFVALATAAFLSACGGGGGDGENDNYVSTQQFASGSVGFWLSGPGGSMSIVSQGARGDVGKSKQKVQISTPSSEFDWDGATGWKVPEGYDDYGISESVTPVCTGQLMSDGRVFTRLDTILYYMEEGGQRAYLEASVPVLQSNNSSLDEGLAHFFGAVTYGNLPTTSGNTLSLVWFDDSMQRVLLTSASGTKIKVWFNFDTESCLIQLSGQVYGTLVGADGAVIVETSGVFTGAVFSSKDCTFRKQYH